MNLLSSEIKQLCYAIFGGDLTDGFVEYIIRGRICVFTGITISRSTINGVDEIIPLIARAENVNPNDLIFFDLQTYLGYSGKKPGQYEFDQVHFYYDRNTPDRIIDGDRIIFTSGPIEIKYWDPATCPDWVLQLFAKNIGTKS